MSNTDPWVEIVRNPPKLFRWPSTADERLVLFRGNVAELLPPGKHKIPYFSLISTLAYVRMSPRHVSSAEWQVVSEDEIPLDILAAVTMRVRPDDASVKRIAKAALLSSDAEVALAMDLVFRAVQELVSVTRYADLPALTDVQSRIERAVGGSAQQHLALDILSVTLRAVHSSDPAVREAQLQSLTSAIHLEQMKVDQERERLEYEHRRAQAALDKQAELERLEEERKFAKRLAQDKLEIETINKEHELKRLQMELNAKVAISKHEADAEVAKADKALTHQLLPLVVKSLVAEGKRQVLEGLIKRQYGMSLTAPVEAELSSSDSPETPDGAAVAEDSGSDGEGSDEPETAL